MRRRPRQILLGALLLLAVFGSGCVASAVDGATTGMAADATKASREGARPKARALSIGRTSFETTEILMRKTMPPQFDVLLVRPMPTPGWTFEIDDVRIEPAERRIVARVSERAPKGVMAQVMTDTTCRVPLGTIEPGAWIFELWLARPGGEHAPAHAMVLVAR